MFSHANSQAIALHLLLPPSSALASETRDVSLLRRQCRRHPTLYVLAAPHASSLHHQESRWKSQPWHLCKVQPILLLTHVQLLKLGGPTLSMPETDLIARSVRLISIDTQRFVINARDASTQATCSNLSSIGCRMKRSLSSLR